MHAAVERTARIARILASALQTPPWPFHAIMIHGELFMRFFRVYAIIIKLLINHELILNQVEPIWGEYDSMTWSWEILLRKLLHKNCIEKTQITNEKLM